MEKKSPQLCIKFFEGITGNIFILGSVSLFTDLSSQMVFPLIPLFMNTVLGCGAYAVGIVEGAAVTTASLLKVVSGYWSDNIRKRKPVLTGAYLIFGITSFGLIFVTSLYSILLLFIVYGIFYAMIDDTQRAFVVDLAPQHLKGTALRVFHTSIGLVALPGGYIAGLLWDVK